MASDKAIAPITIWTNDEPQNARSLLGWWINGGRPAPYDLPRPIPHTMAIAAATTTT